MRPLLHAKPEKQRALLFVPAVLGIAALTFLILGFVTQSFVLAVLLAPFLGVGGAYALLGWPVVRRKDGSPLVGARSRPWLFFVLFPLYTAFAYPFLGLALTSVLPPAFTAYGPLALALLMAGVGAYLSVGFPPLVRDLQGAWARIPARSKPWLSIPGGLVLTLFFYYLFGWLLTTYAGVTWAPLVALPLGLAAGVALAIVAFGYPKPQRRVSEMVPRPPGNARPLLLVGTWLALGFPCAFLMGILIQFAPLPAAYTFPSSILLGFLASFGLSVLIWGLPGKWATLPDYEPGVSPEVRYAMLLPLWIVAAALLTFVIGFFGLDLLPSLVIGVVVGLVAAAAGTGALKAARHYRLPEIPETVKPILFFPVWAAVALLVFLPLTFFLPAWFAMNLLAGALFGFVVAFITVQRDVIRTIAEERARRRELKAEIKRLRKGREPEAEG